MAYNNDQGGEEGEEEEEEEEVLDEHNPYYRQYYPQQPSQLAHSRHGYRSSPTHSEDTELRSPGVARRFPRDAIMKESEAGGH